jgi:hypothetical protein
MEWPQFHCGYRGHAQLRHEEANWYQMVQEEEEIVMSLSKLESNPFPVKQEMVHSPMSMYLQHPQLYHLHMPLQ